MQIIKTSGICSVPCASSIKGSGLAYSMDVYVLDI